MLFDDSLRSFSEVKQDEKRDCFLSFGVLFQLGEEIRRYYGE